MRNGNYDTPTCNLELDLGMLFSINTMVYRLTVTYSQSSHVTIT